MVTRGVSMLRGLLASLAEGKTRSVSMPSVESICHSRIRRAWRESGTRCSWPFFMRVAGIVQVADSRSTSLHRAPRNSPARAAVRMPMATAKVAVVFFSIMAWAKRIVSGKGMAA